ncbi:MAG TPA: hypothetical protein VM871_09825 [Flavisolibacter sp.]|nr:hypothetical protein [Flavisolibacter sp.]
MSLNNMSLSPQLLTDLYKTVLIDGPIKPASVAHPVPFLGKNAKHILLLVNNDAGPLLPDNELAFLTNILSACGFSLNDVAIVNTKNTAGNNASPMLTQLQPAKVVLFNVGPQEFGLSPEVQHYSINNVGTRQIISAPSLTTIEASKVAKKQLWEALKQLFGL